MSKIYLACPYSHQNPAAITFRLRIAAQNAGRLMQEGHIVYSPINHCHPIAEAYSLPTDFEFWKRLNFEFIDWCEELHVLRLPGWNESKGVTAEIDYAKLTNKLVFHI